MKASKLYFSLSVLLITVLTGCKTIGGGVISHAPGPTARHDSPPAHAPAHGRRVQQRFHYHYFPNAQVYFDLDRRLYFYISANRWKVSVSLPEYFRRRLDDQRVLLEMEIAKPYQEFHRHKKQYPPGLAKKKNKGKRKDNKDKKQGRGNKHEDRD